MKPFFSRYTSVRHWFSYNWVWILSGVLLITFLLFAFRPSSEPEPDYVFSWVGTTALSKDEEAAIIDVISQAGTDQNEDGQVTVSLQQLLIDFNMDTSNSHFTDNYSNTLKLLAQIQAKECYLYLLEDPEQFQFFTGILQYLDGSYASEEDHYASSQWEQMCVLWDIKELEHTVYLARRTLFDEADSNTLFPGSDALFIVLSNS